jgi:hypothetical protein
MTGMKEQRRNSAMMISKRKFLLALFVSVCSVGSGRFALAQKAPAPTQQTGQKKCWDATGKLIQCEGTGQDGDKQTGVVWPDPRFTDNHNGTLTDNLTGLTWLRQADCLGRAKWLDAMTISAALGAGKCGLTDGSKPGDWRVPNIIELRSIVDFGTIRPALPPNNFFINFEPTVYWSSSTVPAFPALGWFATFGVGPHVFDLKVNTFRVLPIKGGLTNPFLPRTGSDQCFDASGSVIPCAGTGQDGEFMAGVVWPNPRFTDEGNGSVRDNLTGLFWLKNAHCFGFQAWADALKDANGLGQGKCGLTDGSKPGDWRLPNVRELQSIMDNRTVAPAIPVGSPFVNVQPTLYWTSTSGQNFPLLAYFSLMSAGSTVFEHKNALLGTWAVRSAK